MNIDSKTSTDDSVGYPIPGFEGYRITKSGKVTSIRCRYPTRPEHEIKGWTSKKGYKIVGLMVDGKVKSVPIHKLQERTFLGGPKEGLQIDHIDGNKQNNHVSNLRQVTPLGNVRNPITAKRQRDSLSDPMYRSRLSASIRRKFEDPEYKRKVVDAAKKRLSDPEWRKHHAEAMAEVWSRPEMRKQMFDNLSKMNDDPEMRKYNAQRSRESNSRPCRATNSNGETMTFPSVTECAKHFGLVAGTITRYMRDKVVTDSGWSFNRPDKENK